MKNQALKILLLLLLAQVFSLQASQSFLYWDTNGSTAGAGTNPGGDWANSFWNTAADGTGAPGAWVAGQTAVFSAGSDATNSYTVTVSTAQNAGGIQLEDGTLTLSGTAALTLSSPATIDVAANHTLTVSVALTGSSAFTKTGAGTMYLNGTNNATGPIYIQGGTFAFDKPFNLAGGSTNAFVLDGGANIRQNLGSTFLGGRPLIVTNSGGSVEIPTGQSSTYSAGGSGGLSGSGTLTKIGGGSLTFNNNNSSFTGAIFVSDGLLKVSNFSGSGTGSASVTVNSTGSLSGSGTIGGPVSVFGTISPEGTVSGVPTTLTSSNFTFNSSADYKWKITNATGTAGSGWDLLNINGTMTLAATAGNPVRIDVASVLSGGSAGAAANFASTGEYTWAIAKTTAGISNFDSSFFSISTTSFSNNVGSGRFAVEQSGDGKTLNLRFSHPPTITTQPISKTVNAGSPVLFLGAASGTGTLSYQWQKGGVNLVNGSNITGVNTTNLTIGQAFGVDDGSYALVVNSLYGATTSTVATLLVADPVAVNGPADVQLGAGSNAVFSVVAIGTAPLSYQWTKNGIPLTDSDNISGSSTANLTVSGVSPNDGGTFLVTITNAFGSCEGRQATLNIYDPPTIASQPASVTANMGDNATFEVIAVGPGLSYQWKKNGANLSDNGKISGSTTTMLTLTGVEVTDAGSYSVEVSNVAGAIESDPATLTVYGLELTMTARMTGSESRGTGISIAGSSLFLSGTASANNEGLVARYDLPLLATSSPAWSTTWPGISGQDNFNSIVASADSFYVAGGSYGRTTDSYGNKEPKGMVVKFPLSGASGGGYGGSMWDKQVPAAPGAFGYSGTEGLNAVAMAREANTTYLYLTGVGQSGPSNTARMFLSKMTSESAVQWTVSDLPPVTMPSSYSAGKGVAVLNGNIFVAGRSDDSGSARAVVRKYNSGGTLQWSGDQTPGQFNGITAFAGALYAVGATADSGNSDFLVEKRDESGAVLWTRTYDRNAGQDTLNAVVGLGSRIYAVGSSRVFKSVFGYGDADVIVLEIDPTTGDLLNTISYGGTDDDIANGIITDGTDLYVVGETKSFSTFNNLLLLKVQVSQPPVALSVLGSSLPIAQTNVSYSATLQAGGGKPPYTWELTAGVLPSGLTLSSSGAISGTPTQTGQFNFVATVNDSADTQSTATGTFTLLSIASNSLPTVTLTNPINGASFDAPASLTLSANASDADGIAQVLFYSGSTLLGVVTSPPYSLDVRNIGAGSYALRAVAVDNLGASNASTAIHITVNTPGSTTIDFEALSTASGAVSSTLLANYLANYGVTANNVSAGSFLAANSQANILGGTAVTASSGENVFSQFGINGNAHYTLNFAQTYSTVSFTRAKMLAGTRGITSPTWHAYALDLNGNAIASVGEDLRTSYYDVPAQVFSLFGVSNIAAIRIESDNHNYASFSSVVMDDLVLSTQVANYPPTVRIESPENGATYNAPAQVTITAQASDSDGAVTRIDFYQGKNLIGSRTPVSPSVTVSNLAAGTYTFTAVATDNGGATRSSDSITVTVNAVTGTSVINFDAVDASLGNVSGASLSNYLAGYGISLSNVTAGSLVQVMDAKNLFGGAAVVPTSPNNVLSQAGLNDAVAFTLVFSNTLQSVSFSRAGLTAGPVGASMAGWKARAFDAFGNETASFQESPINSTVDVASRQVQLIAPGIKSLRFDSDGHHTAAFPAVLLDDLIVNTNSVESRLAVSITSPTAGASFTAPSDITITAFATNTAGAIDHVEFYAGPILINTVSNSPYSTVWSNVLSGTYSLKAKAYDANGFALFSSPVTITVAAGSSGNLTIVNFDALDASAGNVSGTSLSTYLATYGITVSDVTSETSLVVQNQSNVLSGAVVASSPENVLRQINASGPAGFTLNFSAPLQQFQLTRPGLKAGSAGVSLASWRAIAYDASGTELSRVSETATFSTTDLLAQTFTLTGPGIVSVKVRSEGTSFGTFNTVPLDDFVMTTSADNTPPSIVITSPAALDTFQAPANIPITASATDSDGSISQVAFYANGNWIATDTTPPYSITWSNVAVGKYALRAIASDNAGATRWSATVNIVVEPSPFVFGIRSQPVSQTVAAGSDVGFAVETTGTNAVTYQWRFDGNAIPGATTSQLRLTAVTSGDAGSYSVVCVSGGNTLTSDDAILSILDAPVITRQPTGQTVSQGDNLTLSIDATGASPLFYQWRLNGRSVSGATNSAYAITGAKPGDAGKYSVIVRNSVGIAQSDVANIAVLVGTGIPNSADNFADRIPINPLAGPVIGNNENATRETGEPDHANKVGGKSIWYTWHATFTGVISLTTRGSDFDTLLAVYTGDDVAHLTEVTSDDDGGDYFSSLVTFNVIEGTDYHIAIDGFKGSSGNVILAMPPGIGYRLFDPTANEALPVITLQPEDQILQAGDTVSLNVAASSTSPLTYQWYYFDSPILGATDNSLVLSNFQEESIGRYSVLVGNDSGSVRSKSVVIQLGTVDQSATASTTSQDKFGDIVDLSGGGGSAGGSGGSHSIRPRPTSGGDTRGYSVTQVFSTVGSSKEAGEPNHCNQEGGASEWYSYTTPTNNLSLLHITTDGSTFNTILAVYIGPGTNFETLTNVGCDYTTNYTTYSPRVNITNPAPNTTYFIAVDGMNGASGTAHLNISYGNALSVSTPPQDQYVAPSSNATFTVRVDGSTNYFYHWRFNSTYISGATNSSYTVSNAQNASQGNYSVVVSNLVSVVTNSPPAVLTVQYAPLILTQPTNITANSGTTISLITSAVGASALRYQWYRNGALVSRATNATLSITNVQSTNVGSFSLVVSNSYGTVTSATAVVSFTDVTLPRVTVTSPADKFKTNGPTLTVRGTATDNTRVTNVLFKVGSNDFQSATGTTNWTAVLTLVPGTNVFTVKCVDSSGNESTNVTRSYFYSVKVPLTVITNGYGRITSTTGATNNALLEIGRNYTVTASIPTGTNYIFTNWYTGTNVDSLGFATNTTTMIFMMQSNLIVQGNFGTNPFTAVSGIYNGLFYPTNGVTHQSSGFISVTLSRISKGPFSGFLRLDGGTHSFSGTFDLNGDARRTITRSGKTPVTLALHLNIFTPDDQISGSVSNVAFISPVLADRATFNLTNNPATNYNGRYTMAIPPTNSFPAESPGGYGAVLFTNNINGSVIATGNLGDGTAISQTVPLSPGGNMPLYVSLYGGRGSVLGWMNFTNQNPPKTLSGTLSWIKFTNYSGVYYTKGFTNQVDVLGSLFTPITTTTNRIIDLPTGVLTMADGNMSSSLTYNISNSLASAVTKVGATPTNYLAAAYVKSTGALTVTFRPTGSSVNKVAKGVVLQGSTNAFGWFLGTDQSGSLYMH